MHGFCNIWTVGYGMMLKLRQFSLLIIFVFSVGHEEPDIFCIGFQEIVKLSPQQVC